MTDLTAPPPHPPSPDASGRPNEALARKLRARQRSEARFKALSIAATAIAILTLAALLFGIVSKGYTAFWHTHIELDVYFDPETLDPAGDATDERLAAAGYNLLLARALYEMFPEVQGRKHRKALKRIVSEGAEDKLRRMVLADRSVIGTTRPVWLIANDHVDMLRKGYIDRDLPEADRAISDRAIGWCDRLAERGRIESVFNTTFLTGGDSREGEQAGIWGATAGSFLTMLVTFLLAFPVGVAAAVYLEEFAPRNRLTDLIEVNINNLAAVPSIVFGLLGAAVLLGWFFPGARATPLVGGMVLALMTLPTIAIASRAALRAVPPSIREAALAMGASPMQTVSHHVLPLAMPGILTGAIVGMAQALGETAPLLMVGMVAFIADIPTFFDQPATVLPVQIFLWADRPERSFVEKTSAAIMVLLFFLTAMNLLAILLRKRFERRW